MKSRGRRAIPIALRPLVFMKLYDALHHRTSPAGRGLGAVDNATYIYTKRRLLKLDVVSN